MFGVFERTSPLVEGLSIDEAFLDVRGLERIAGSPAEIAADLRRRVREEVGLPITVGVATTKFLAKVASAVAKPDGLLVVPAGGERAFLHPLPVEALWGVGPATAGRLRARGLATVGQVARLDETALVALLGQAVGRQDARAGPQPRPPPRPAWAGAAPLGGVAVRHGLHLAAARGDGRGRWSPWPTAWRGARARSGRIGRTIVLRMRYGDYTRAARSRTLADATADTRAILAAARELLDEARPDIERRGLTLLGIAVTNLDDGGPVQLVLPIDGARHRALDAAVNRVRERFGTTSLTRASLSGEHRGLAPWLPPD